MANFARVTEILRPFSGYHHVPDHILTRAAARGIKVHAYCTGMAKGAWVPMSMIEEELKGYVDSFTSWYEAQVKESLIIEKRYEDDLLEYSGQVDMVVKSHEGKLYLVDLKTSAQPQKTYPIQMAAYRRLLRLHDISVEAAMLVYLKKDGSFPDIDYLEDTEEELAVFMAAIKCYRYFNKEKKNEREAA